MIRFISLALSLVLFAVTAKCDIDDKCLKCMCEAKGCEKEVGKCDDEAETPTCGPYQITEAYWKDCGKPGGDWKECTKEMECSEKCVRAYMKRYGEKCTGGREPTCEDYAKIHQGGPQGCNKSDDEFWEKVEKCLG